MAVVEQDLRQPTAVNDLRKLVLLLTLESCFANLGQESAQDPAKSVNDGKPLT